MATLPPSASPFDPVLEIEHGTIDGAGSQNRRVRQQPFMVNPTAPKRQP